MYEVPTAVGWKYARRVITNVYLDGFNLYYGCLKGQPHKWLDLEAMCARLLPKNEIKRIRYFTARVTDVPHFSRSIWPPTSGGQV